MSTISHVSDPSNLSEFQADMLAIEREIETRLNADQIADSIRCTGCGDFTEGVTIAGSHIHVCPDCVAGFVAAQAIAAGLRPLPELKPITIEVRKPNPALWPALAR